MILVKTATDSEGNADRIAGELLRTKLCAGCQVYQVNSTYWWEGKVKHKAEWVVEARTSRDTLVKVFELIKSIHTYELPEVIALTAIAEKTYDVWTRKRDKYINKEV